MSEPSISVATLSALGKAVEDDPYLHVSFYDHRTFLLHRRKGGLSTTTKIMFDVICDAVEQTKLVQRVIEKMQRILEDELLKEHD